MTTKEKKIAKTPQAAFDAIQRAADTANVDARPMMELKIGEVIHQGDIYLHRVAEDHPHGPIRNSEADIVSLKQLVPGSTVGARHLASGNVFEGKEYPPGFNEPDGCQPGALLGPVIVFGATELQHPEHAHHSLRADYVYQVTYQYNPRTMRAVQD